MAARLARLEDALDEAVQTAPAPMRVVIEARQALRGVAQVSRGHDRGRTRPGLALCPAPAADEL